MEQLILILIGAILSAILALIKITIWTSLAWIWVLFPLLACLGIFLLINLDFID